MGQLSVDGMFMVPQVIHFTGPTACEVDITEIYEASLNAPRLLLSRLVKGAFCLPVRATRFLSTVFVSYFSSGQKEKETCVYGRSKQLWNGFLACEESEVAMPSVLGYQTV